MNIWNWVLSHKALVGFFLFVVVPILASKRLKRNSELSDFEQALYQLPYKALAFTGEDAKWLVIQDFTTMNATTVWLKRADYYLPDKFELAISPGHKQFEVFLKLQIGDVVTFDPSQLSMSGRVEAGFHSNHLRATSLTRGKMRYEVEGTLLRVPTTELEKALS